MTLRLGSMLLAASLVLPSRASAMHISEGILPAGWALFWFALAAPFVAWGVKRMTARKAAGVTRLQLLEDGLGLQAKSICDPGYGIPRLDNVGSGVLPRTLRHVRVRVGLPQQPAQR